MPMFTNMKTGPSGGMFNITWSIAGQEQLNRTLGQMVEKSTSFRELWLSQEFKDILYGAEKQQFATEGSHGSGGWAPLSPEYAAQKAKTHPGKPILQREGHLWRSLTDPNADGAVYAASNKTLTWGTQVPYAIFHQTGTANMPDRPPIEFTEAERREIVKALQKHIFTIQGTPIRRHH